MVDGAEKRNIRSFVRRQGRITQGQKRALEELWPKWGKEIHPDTQLDLAELFINDHPVYLEIGFGNGESLIEYARRYPKRNYLGVEVHKPGIGHLLVKIEALQLTNIRILCKDATEIIQQLADSSLDGMMLFFPDPWHKKRHHKRRLFQTSFVKEMERVISPGGVLHVATDWQDYAEEILELLEKSHLFSNSAGSGYHPRPIDRELTRFEKRGLKRGHDIYDMIFQRQ